MLERLIESGINCNEKYQGLFYLKISTSSKSFKVFNSFLIVKANISTISTLYPTKRTKLPFIRTEHNLSGRKCSSESIFIDAYEIKRGLYIYICTHICQRIKNETLQKNLHDLHPLYPSSLQSELRELIPPSNLLSTPPFDNCQFSRNRTINLRDKQAR